MKRSIICILTAAVLLICSLPVCADDISDKLTDNYIKNADMSDFWTVLASSSLGLETDASISMPEKASALNYASALLMERASGRSGEEYERLLVSCLHENGSIHNDNDSIDVKIGQYATSQALSIIALEVAGADYDRDAAISYLFSQQCPNGGLGYYEYDDVSTSCWGMIAYIMSGADAHDEAAKLQEYISAAVKDNVVYEYGAPNLWSTAAYITLLEAQKSQKVFDVYDAFINAFYADGVFSSDYQPAQGVLAVGCRLNGCLFLNLRDGVSSSATQRETFPDMEGHPAREAVYKLCERGIVGGINGYFEPDKAVTRAQAAKMFTLTAGGQTESGADFDDVDENAWYAPFVGYCAKNGIVGGYMGLFRPDDNITDVEFRLMCSRAGYELKVALSPTVTRAQAAAVLAEYVK